MTDPDNRVNVQAEIDLYEGHTESVIERAVAVLPKRTQKAIKSTDQE